MLEKVGWERGDVVTVVFVVEVAGYVLCDVLNKLKVNGGPNETGEWSKKNGGAQEGFVVPPDTSLR